MVSEAMAVTDLTRSKYYWWLLRMLEPDWTDRAGTLAARTDTVSYYLFRARTARAADFRPRPEVVGSLLTELVTMDETTFRARFAGTAVMRAGRGGLARNACVVLGNVGGEGAIEALTGALEDESPLVREHAAWALTRLGWVPG